MFARAVDASLMRPGKLERSQEVSQVRKLNPVMRHRGHCREVRAQMSDRLDGEVDPGGAAGVERRVRWRPDCRHLGRTIGGLRVLCERLVLADDSGLEAQPGR
jgi:hypothetical protein